MQDIYDEVAYPSLPRSQTHPAHLATLAVLHGLSPAPLERCRVLELGCGDGANLVPMAFDYPGSDFAGIDRAESPLNAGRALAAELGLRNIRFEQADLLHWTPAPGAFDYIIAHGIYSWTPAEVREKTLEVSKRGLSPHGVAFISYNALPGCHFRRFVWDLLRFHTRDLPDPRDKIAQARALAKLVVEQFGDDPRRLSIKSEFATLLERSEGAVFHDDLSELNVPFSVFQFVEDAAQHGLQYLSDADLQRDDVRGLPFSTGKWLDDRQYADYFSGRRFRETLLCHEAAPVVRKVSLDRMVNLYAASRAEPGAEQADGTMRFNLPMQQTLFTNHALAKRMLCRLSAIWPESLPVSSLPVAEAPPEEVVDLLMRLFQAGAIELRVRPPKLACAVSERPVSSLLARSQLSRGLSRVTNQRHLAIELNDGLSRMLVTLMDGSRDRDALRQALRQALESGAVGAELESGRPPTREDVETLLGDKMDMSLQQMMRLCLLVQ